MSVQAFDWLSSKLGLNITGRNDSSATSPPSGVLDNMEYTKSSTHLSATTFGEDFSPEEDGPMLGKYWNQVNQKVSSCIGNQGSTIKNFFKSIGNHKNTGATNRNVNTMFSVDEAVNNELDENGLPVTQNWYFYDNEIGRWNVLPGAPEAVRREYEEKLRAEAERANQPKVIPPPPPMMGTQNTNGMGPPPRGVDAVPKGMFAPAATNEGGIPKQVLGPRYSMPDYFNTTPPSFAMESPNPPTAMAAPPPGGIYNSYSGFGVQGAQDSSRAGINPASLEFQPRANNPLPRFPGENPALSRPSTASLLATPPDGLVWPPPPPFAPRPADSGLSNPPGGPAARGAGVARYQNHAAAPPPGHGGCPSSIGGFPSRALLASSTVAQRDPCLPSQ